MGQDLHLVGSIPLDTVEEVFRTFGGPLGQALATMPDGEVGPRSHWISRVHYQVLSGHPELEAVQRPKPDDNGVERLYPRNASESWMFRVKDGVEKVRFGDPGWRLGYARDAINSYFVFKTLRDKGALAKHLRFQVSLPSVNSTLPPRIFPNPADVAKVRAGYQDALAAEIGTIVAKIPNEDLAIQWDCSTEVHDAYGSIPNQPGDPIERNMAQFRALSPLIPEKVMLGIHFCFGTLGGWPRFAPDDLSATVRLANAAVEACGRRVDWIHIPVLERTDDAFFVPLKDLKQKGARVYLGAIHHMDTFAQRIATARKYLPEFGVGAYCGFGRMPPSDIPKVLEEHQQAIKLAK